MHFSMAIASFHGPLFRKGGVCFEAIREIKKPEQNPFLPFSSTCTITGALGPFEGWVLLKAGSLAYPYAGSHDKTDGRGGEQRGFKLERLCGKEGVCIQPVILIKNMAKMQHTCYCSVYEDFPCEMEIFYLGSNVS